MNPLEELKARTDAFISVDDAAKAIGVSPQAIRCAARDNPLALNFPTVTVGEKGKHIRIPRLPLINLIESGTDWYETRARILQQQ